MFSMSEAFYLATRGGAEVLGLANTCGDLTVGKKCDVLVVNTGIEPMDLFGFETLVTRNRQQKQREGEEKKKKKKKRFHLLTTIYHFEI
jgi:cytosine/adenosine deaminase-related metal-dependent hydrolase